MAGVEGHTSSPETSVVVVRVEDSGPEWTADDAMIDNLSIKTRLGAVAAAAAAAAVPILGCASRLQ